MRRTAKAMGAAAAALALGLTAMQGASAGTGGRSSHHGSSGSHAVGLTTAGKLVWFNLNSPWLTHKIGPVSGLVGDTKLVGIDYRVQDQKLYGVGDAGGVYTLKTSTASASKVSQLTVALAGTQFGVDFNPAADRLRIVSDAGQNLRHDVNPGGVTVTDGTLTYPPAVTPVTGVAAAAYTNNDLDATTGTTLFDIDSALDQVALQSPANSGQLVPTGKLGVDAAAGAGFDIESKVHDGVTRRNRAWATLSVGGRYHLYSVSLLTGAVDDRGEFPIRRQVTDLAVVLDE